MRITNKGGSTVTLPNGADVPAGATVTVADDAWKTVAKHPVVVAWLHDKHLEAAPDEKSAKAAAKPETAPVNPLA